MKHPITAAGRRTVVGVLALGLLAGALAVAVQAQQPTDPRVAVLARADNPVDALAASAVAAQLGGIVLLTPSDRLGPDARQGLLDFGPTLVVLAGGTAALSSQVESDVRAAGFANVRRVAGVTRFETALALSRLPQELGVSYLPKAAAAADAHRLAGRTYEQVLADAEARQQPQPDNIRLVHQVHEPDPIVSIGGPAVMNFVTVEVPVPGTVVAECQVDLIADSSASAYSDVLMLTAVDDDVSGGVITTLTVSPANDGVEFRSITESFTSSVAAGSHDVGCVLGQVDGTASTAAYKGALNVHFLPDGQARSERVGAGSSASGSGQLPGGGQDGARMAPDPASVERLSGAFRDTAGRVRR